MTRIVFLSSGGGGNFHFVRECIAEGLLPGASLLSVVSDRNGPVMRWCEANGHSSQIVDFTLERQDETLLPVLSNLAPDIVVTNIARLVAPAIVRRFDGRMINLHYSLLPAYAGTIGLFAPKVALAEGQRFCGATVHLVSEEVDAGRQIGQVAIPMRMAEGGIGELGEVVFRCGALLLVCAIAAMVNGRQDWSDHVLRIGARNVLFNAPEATLAHMANEEVRWMRVKSASHA